MKGKGVVNRFAPETPQGKVVSKAIKYIKIFSNFSLWPRKLDKLKYFSKISCKQAHTMAISMMRQGWSKMALIWGCIWAKLIGNKSQKKAKFHLPMNRQLSI